MNNKINLSEAKCTCVLVVKRTHEIPGLRYARNDNVNKICERIIEKAFNYETSMKNLFTLPKKMIIMRVPSDQKEKL